MSRPIRFRGLARQIQPMGEFEPADPQSGYYNDLRRVATVHDSPEAALDELRRLSADRVRANPVSIAQLGLAAWQLRVGDAHWLGVTDAACHWLLDELDEDGRLAYHFPMPHTYHVLPPWYSAMAQGEAASLLARAAHALGEERFADASDRAAGPLLAPGPGLVVETAEGPVLQEYPTSPPAHVLNGWIFALWGLYDVSLLGGPRGDAAARAFAAGATALARRLPLYEVGLHWSRYDLFPHPIVHVASPFYQRLHAEQLLATARLCPDLPVLATTGERWRRAAARPVARSIAVVRKVAFRVVRPRGRAV